MSCFWWTFSLPCLHIPFTVNIFVRLQGLQLLSGSGHAELMSMACPEKSRLILSCSCRDTWRHHWISRRTRTACDDPSSCLRSCWKTMALPNVHGYAWGTTSSMKESAFPNRTLTRSAQRSRVLSRSAKAFLSLENEHSKVVKVWQALKEPWRIGAALRRCQHSK